MARNRSGRPGRAATFAGVAAGVLLAGCSGGGHKAAGLPDPGPGTVAAFDLDGLNSRYPLQRDVSDIPFGSHVAAGRTGDVYVMHRTSSDGSTEILRLTSQGAVSRFASLGPGPTAFGLAALPDGTLVVGRGGTLLRTTGRGAPAALPDDHRFTDPVPIGARPDGSLVVLDGSRVWSVRNGHSAALAAAQADELGPGTVDGAGRAYVVPAGKNRLDAVLVIPPGGAPHTLRVTGHLPGGSAPVSGLDVYTLASAGDDGFYATAGTPDGTATYLIRVHGTTADVLAAFGAPGKAATCAAGHHYPALDNPCVMPYFALPLGKRVLLVGQTDDEAPTPALALQTASAGAPSP